MGYSNSCRSYRIFNKHTLCIEESMHVVFDYTNHIVKNSNFVDDEFEQVNKTKCTRTEADSPLKSIDTITWNDQFTIEIVLKEWRIKIDYLEKFIIGEPKKGMNTKASSKRSANVSLISQLEPIKLNEA